MIKAKTFLNLFLILIMSSCSSINYEEASGEGVEGDYNRIKKNIADGNTMIAGERIMRFEKKYPKSKYNCELLNIRAEMFFKQGHTETANELKERALKYCEQE